MNRHSTLRLTVFYGPNLRGFTLIEILVAIFIFSVLATMLFSSFNFFIRNVESVQHVGVVEETSSQCLLRFTLDLESAKITPKALYNAPGIGKPHDPHRIVGGAQMEGSGGAPGLRFFSHAHLPIYGGPKSACAEIVYYFDPSEEGTGVLRRSDRVFTEEPFEKSTIDPVICESVKSVSFLFYDKEGNASDHWDSDSEEFSFATPSAVSIQIEVAGDSAAQDFGARVALPVVREKDE